MEGLPEHMNPPELTEKDEWESSPSESEYEMWRIRRCLYMICTRAWAFLYFVTSEDTAATSRWELNTLIEQLSRPVRRGCESGQTWEFKVETPKTARVPLVFRDAENELTYWEEERTKQAEEENREVVPVSPLRVVRIDLNRDLDLPYLSRVLGIKRKALISLLPNNHAGKTGDDLRLTLQQANMLAKRVGILLKSG